MAYPQAQTDRFLNTVRGKNLIGKATKDEISKVFEHIDALETLLDDVDEDAFVRGWRRKLGLV
jgi:hypothetical protein